MVLLTLLLLAVPSVLTLQALLELLVFGERVHQLDGDRIRAAPQYKAAGRPWAACILIPFCGPSGPRCCRATRRRSS